MKTVGCWLACAGIVWLVYGFAMDTSVASSFSAYGARVTNLGLVEARRTHLMLAGLMTLIGIILIGFGNNQERAGDDVTDIDERDCPFCAEPVRAEAVFCKHCRQEISALEPDDPSSEFDADSEEEQWSEPDAMPDDGVSYSYRALREAAEAAEAGVPSSADKQDR